MEVEVELGHGSHTVRVDRHPDGGWEVQIGDAEPVRVVGGRLGHGDWALTWGGRRRLFGAHVDGDRVDLQADARAWRASVVDARKAALMLGAGGAAGLVATQMPGVIVRVLVQPGDEVAAGDPVVVVEAMKMENEFKSPVDGTVSIVHVADGDRVEAGTALVTVDPA